MKTQNTTKILWKGPVFNPTGIATSAREMIKALAKKENVEVQCSDVWHSNFEFNEGLSFLNKPIDPNVGDVHTIMFDYPQFWRDGWGKVNGAFIHEGTKLHEGWIPQINNVEKLMVFSESNKKMFTWNGITVPMTVVPLGFDPEIYKKRTEDPEGTFVFLSVNSWGGTAMDRKGTDLLIKAFDEEFKEDEDVRLLLKVSTFWQQMPPGFYSVAVNSLLGHKNDKIMVNQDYLPEKELANFYPRSSIFVAPTRGEGFGLTLLNSLACGLPVITTKDDNSGHMDFCRNNPGVLWVDAPERLQGDPRFFAQGNLLAEPSLEDLKKQMRWAYENRDKLFEMGQQGADFVKDWTWDRSADKILEFLKKEEKRDEIAKGLIGG